MAHTLTAKEQSLAKIFSDDFVFTIPSYQRPYAWGMEQAQELLDDLVAALPAAPDKLDAAAPYFLGSIVLIKHEASPEATVVDGQQRLTTLTLLLAAIRASVNDKAVQEGISKRIYEQGDVVSATQARYRLSLRERDRDFFRNFVQHEDGLPKLLAHTALLTDSQTKLRVNAQLFMAALAGYSQPHLVRLVQFIITRCYLVTVATPDLDSAYRIFGVLNSRGLDLSATDILKAEIIGSVPAPLRDAYTKKWEDAEDNLGRDAFGDLFSHIRMVYRKAKPQGTLLKEFKEHVVPALEPQSFIDEVLLPMAQCMSAVLDTDYASPMHAEQINTHLKWLNRLEFKDWVPPALAFMVRHSHQPERVLGFFADLERLAFSMLSRKSGVNERIERFSKLTTAIEKSEPLELETSPLQLAPLEQYETYQALNGPLYETHSPRAVAVLMLRLDALLSDGSASYQHEVVSVEHVMPQQPALKSEWFDWVPHPKDQAEWVHRLGNLALLSRKKNSAASNYGFGKKKTAYFVKGGVCAFALTTQVLAHADWTVDVMQQRQSTLLARLQTHWRLENRKSPAELKMAQLQHLHASTQGEPLFELGSAKHGIKAQACQKKEGFTVLCGSQAKHTWTGPHDGYHDLHQALCAAGKLAPSNTDNCLVFAEDVVFSSPSAASAVVLGRHDNGRESWRLVGTSISYAAWHAQQASRNENSSAAPA